MRIRKSLGLMMLVSAALISTSVNSASYTRASSLMADEYHKRTHGDEKTRLVCENKTGNKWAGCGTTHYPIATQSMNLGTHTNITYTCPSKSGYTLDAGSYVRNRYSCTGSFRYYTKKQVTTQDGTKREVDLANSHFYEKQPVGTLSGNIKASSPISAASIRARLTADNILRYEREGGHSVNNSCSRTGSTNYCYYTKIPPPPPPPTPTPPPSGGGGGGSGPAAGTTVYVSGLICGASDSGYSYKSGSVSNSHKNSIISAYKSYSRNRGRCAESSGFRFWVDMVESHGITHTMGQLNSSLPKTSDASINNAIVSSCNAAARAAGANTAEYIEGSGNRCRITS